MVQHWVELLETSHSTRRKKGPWAAYRKNMRHGSAISGETFLERSNW